MGFFFLFTCMNYLAIICYNMIREFLGYLWLFCLTNYKTVKLSFTLNTTHYFQNLILYKKRMIRQQNTSLKDALNKAEVEQYFDKIFSDQSNTVCFECGKKTKQWVDKFHAIYLCLSCAALYKQLKWAIEVKSIGLDLWSKKQLQLLLLGGNRKFKEFIANYDLSHLGYKDKLKTNAAHYYRIMLREIANGRQAPEPPTKQKGIQFAKLDIPLTDMTSDQILGYTKEKALWLGSKTKQLGGKAIDKVHHKVTSGQLKQDAKKVAKQVNEKAKSLWGFVRSKIKDLKDDKKGEVMQNQKQPEL